MPLVDTHAHLDEQAFDSDRSAVLERATQEGVVRVITIGTTARSSASALEIATADERVYAAVGIQPNYVAQAEPGDWQTIEQLAAHPRVVAIGETGLDRYWDFAPLDLQRDYFLRHIELAARRSLPFVVHCREAETEVIETLSQAARPLAGVMHSFTGSRETARRCLDLGLYVSIAGMVTYKKSHELRSVVREIPLDRLLVETDAPYLPPQPMRGKRNEPAFLRVTANCLAELTGCSPDELARRTTENACRLFKLNLPGQAPA